MMADQTMEDFNTENHSETLPQQRKNISFFDNETSVTHEPPLSICLTFVYNHRDLTQMTSVRAVIVVAYVTVAVLAVLGNLLVIWTVWRNNHMHTVTNYYIVNLAISDLLVAVMVMPLKLLEYTADCSWQVFRTDALCVLVYYLLPIFVFASVLTLVAISIERYYAIVHPLSAMKINCKSRTRKILALTWLIPIVVASPYIYCKSMAFTIYSEYGVISRQICTDRFNEIDTAMYGDDVSKQGSFRKGFFLFLCCTIFLLPSIAILTTCIKIAISLLQPITVENSHLGRKDTSRRHEENKRKVARMVIVIAVTFIVSWSPQYLVSAISQLQKESFIQESNFFFTMLMTHFFGFVNSCLNPIIYTAMSQKFRRSFREIVRRIFFCCSHGALLQYQTRNVHSYNRYTSTLRQTFSDTEGHQMAMNESPPDLTNQRAPEQSSSSGGDSENRSYTPDQRVIKRYVFKNNCGGKPQQGDELGNCGIKESSFTEPKRELKGILKRGYTKELVIENEGLADSENSLVTTGNGTFQ